MPETLRCLDVGDQRQHTLLRHSTWQLDARRHDQRNDLLLVYGVLRETVLPCTIVKELIPPTRLRRVQRLHVIQLSSATLNEHGETFNVSTAGTNAMATLCVASRSCQGRKSSM